MSRGHSQMDRSLMKNSALSSMRPKNIPRWRQRSALEHRKLMLQSLSMRRQKTPSSNRAETRPGRVSWRSWLGPELCVPKEHLDAGMLLRMRQREREGWPAPVEPLGRRAGPFRYTPRKLYTVGMNVKMDPVNAEENLILSLREDVKTLAEEESNRRVEQLLNTGYDVLIIVAETESIISKRMTADGRRGTLYIRWCGRLGDGPPPGAWRLLWSNWTLVPFFYLPPEIFLCGNLVTRSVSLGGCAGRGGGCGVWCRGGGCWGLWRGCWAGWCGVPWGRVLGAVEGAVGGGVRAVGGGCWGLWRGCWAGWCGVPWGRVLGAVEGAVGGVVWGPWGGGGVLGAVAALVIKCIHTPVRETAPAYIHNCQLFMYVLGAAEGHMKWCIPPPPPAAAWGIVIHGILFHITVPLSNWNSRQPITLWRIEA